MRADYVSCVLCCWCQRAHLLCFPTLVSAFTHHTLQMSACSPFLWMLCCQCFMTYSLILTHQGHQYLIEVEATFSHGLRMDMVCLHNTHSVQMHISVLFLQSYLHMKLCWSQSCAVIRQHKLHVFGFLKGAKAVRSIFVCFVEVKLSKNFSRSDLVFLKRWNERGLCFASHNSVLTISVWSNAAFASKLPVVTSCI